MLGQNELTAEGLKYAYKKLHAFIGLSSTPHVGVTIIVSPQWMFLATIQNPYLLETQLNLHHFPTNRKIDPIYDSIALEDGEQTVFVSTHGHSLSDSAANRLVKFPKVTLLISPFNHYKLPVFLGGVVSPGIEGLSQLMEKVKPNYVVATHDEDKEAKGLVSKFAKVVSSPEEAELKKIDFLKNSYLAINDYEIHELIV